MSLCQYMLIMPKHINTRCTCAVINPTKAGPCITKCNATYHYHECNHDCLIDGFNDGNCDPKTQMCCCTSHPPNN